MVVEFGFQAKDVYDFSLKTFRNTYEREGKKIVTKGKRAVFKNSEIDECTIQRLTASNAPEVLKNIEYFTAPCPYGKFGAGDKYEFFGWNDLASSILAFKHGYVDGFMTSSGGLFQPIGTFRTEGFIVVDPIKREEVRKYFNEEFKEFIDECKDEDFEYGIKATAGFSDCRIGTDLDKTLDEWYNSVFKDLTNDESAKKEKWLQKCSTLEEAAMRIAKRMYYCHDLYNLWGQRTANPLTFKTKKEAEEFAKEYATLKCSDSENKIFVDVIPVNEKFDSYIREAYNAKSSNIGSAQIEKNTKINGGKDINYPYFSYAPFGIK